jgi:hypothetical protein
MFDEIKAAFPKAKFFDRTSMNTWEDKAVCPTQKQHPENCCSRRAITRS